MAGTLSGFKTVKKNLLKMLGKRQKMLGRKSAPKTGSKKKANPAVIKSGLCYVLNFKCIKSITENILSVKECFPKGKFLLGANAGPKMQKMVRTPKS